MMSEKPESLFKDRTGPAVDSKGKFAKGNAGSGGRPKGSRNKLANKFIDDLYEVWQERGREVLEWMADNDPSGLARVTSNLLPRDVKMDVQIRPQIVRLPSHMNDHELEALGHRPKMPNKMPMLLDVTPSGTSKVTVDD